MKQKVHANERPQILILGFSFVTPSTSFGPQQKIYQMKESTSLDNCGWGGGFTQPKTVYRVLIKTAILLRIRLVTPYVCGNFIKNNIRTLPTHVSSVPICMTSLFRPHAGVQHFGYLLPYGIVTFTFLHLHLTLSVLY